MKKLLTFSVLTMQRYEEKATRENLFNESPLIFSKTKDLYFININP